MLDLACGRGRHLQELRRAGYRAAGCDLSWILLRSAQKSDAALPLVRGDMRTLPFERSSFAALVNFFTSFGYFETEDENIEVVREMCRVLQPGGRFLFDYLNVDRELEKMVHRETRQTDAGEIEIERWFDPSARTFNKRIRMGERWFLERVRGYDLDEISTLFAANGFAIRDVYGDFDGSEFRRDSPRLILIGSRRR